MTVLLLILLMVSPIAVIFMAIYLNREISCIRSMTNQLNDVYNMLSTVVSDLGRLKNYDSDSDMESV